MKLSWQNLILFAFILIGAGIEFSERYYEFSTQQFWLIALALVVVTFIGYRINKDIGPTLSFFLIVHLCRYFNEEIADLFGADFSGTYFLLPVVIFTLMIVFIKPIKLTINWWRRDVFTKSILLQIIAVWIVGSLAMYWYLSTHPEHLPRFLEMLPRGEWFVIVPLGFAFALLNAAVEEFMIRGMIWNGLEKIIYSPVAIILFQAKIFGLSHYLGLPGGIEGVLMIFVWSLFIGYVRWKTVGLGGAILLHFLANLSQFFMLYSFL